MLIPKWFQWRHPWLWSAAVLLALALALIGWRQVRDIRVSHDPHHIVLLIPDDMGEDAPLVQLWLDAAFEEGVLLRPLPIGQWVRGSSYGETGRRPVGVILPDTFHRQVSNAAVSMLQEHVEQGGQFMLVRDGGVLDGSGTYAPGNSRLSGLAGVTYGNYTQAGGNLSSFSAILGSSKTMEMLGIPPGRYLSTQTTLQAGGDLFGQHTDQPVMRVSGYSKELQRFPHFDTKGRCPGTLMLHTPQGDVVACQHRVGQGQSLFVNLPLTYLKQRTDGIFLHGFLKYFAQRMVGLPTLSATPDGIGAIVLNWHNDDGPAEHWMRKLQEAGIFNYGRHSFHFTAGPDVDVEGDGKGMNLPHNRSMQQLIDGLRRQGHAIASHGGWIHNHFGHNVTEDNGDDFVHYLELNHKAVTAANGGVEPIEYSAPMGNHPLWAHDWMAEHGIIGYYSVGNVGMAPTRLWMGERRVDDGWAFPVMTTGPVATAEEAHFQRVPVAHFSEWLRQVVRFVEQSGTMRLVYFHPVGAVMYLPSVTQFVQATERCVQAGRCQWQTMTEGTLFLNRRLLTDWTLGHVNGRDALQATHPETLARLAWQVPVRHYARVQVAEGDATVTREGDFWKIRVNKGKRMKAWLTPTQTRR